MEVLARTILVLIGLLVGVLGLLFVLAIVNPMQHEGNVAQFDPKHRQFRDDPVLGHTILERAHGFSLSDGRLFSYYYGDLGERISDPSESKNDTTPDVVIIGSSISWGQGVKNPNTLASVLRRDTDLKTINLSVPGASTLYSALRLEKFPHLRPKVIVYVFYDDHLYRNIRECFPADAPLCVRLPIVEKDGQ